MQSYDSRDDLQGRDVPIYGAADILSLMPESERETFATAYGDGYDKGRKYRQIQEEERGSARLSPRDSAFAVEHYVNRVAGQGADEWRAETLAAWFARGFATAFAEVAR